MAYGEAAPAAAHQKNARSVEGRSAMTLSS